MDCREKGRWPLDFMSSCKILHVITGLNTGGAERALLHLCAHDNDSNQTHVVVSLGSRGAIGLEFKAAGIEAHALGMQGYVIWPIAAARLFQIVRRIRPDVVQGWMYHGNLAATVCAAAMDWRPALAWNIRHSLYDISYEKRLTRWVIRGNRALSARPWAIVYNSVVARSQHEVYGFQGGKGCVIPNGFDLQKFRPDEETRRAVRAELGIPDKAVIIGHVARLHQMKDHAGLLQSMSPILAYNPDVHLVLVGREVERSNKLLEPHLSRMPEIQVHCLGERKDVERIMAAMDIMCSSSAYGEAFPNILGEAMACEVTCIATDVGDSARIIGDTGSMVPPKNAMALREALEMMISRPAEERTALGKSARDRIAAHYSINAIVGRYQELYGRLSTGEPVKGYEKRRKK